MVNPVDKEHNYISMKEITVKELQKIIEQKPELLTKLDNDECSILIQAIRNGRTDLVEELLNLGADYNTISPSFGITTLQQAKNIWGNIDKYNDIYKGFEQRTTEGVYGSNKSDAVHIEKIEQPHLELSSQDTLAPTMGEIPENNAE